MALPDPRRLAAVDMYGARGTVRRARVIRAEFVAGALGCTLLGILSIVQGGAGWIVFGAWMVGIGANYLLLSLEAQRLSRPGALDAELAGVDLRRELRAATKAQVWIAVPLAICLAAIIRSRSG